MEMKKKLKDKLGYRNSVLYYIKRTVNKWYLKR